MTAAPLPSIDEIKRLLDLKPLPVEGGFYAETYRSALNIPATALAGYSGPRAICTAIYYLLTPDAFSAIHRLRGDEIFHFYLGDTVEMLQLFPDGRGELVRLGPNLNAGERPQLVVPKNVWQGSRLAPEGRFALLGTTVAPGFDYADYEHGNRDTLLNAYPDFTEVIGSLTKE